MSTATPPRIFRVYPSQTSSAIPIQFITISDSAGNPVQLSPPPPLIRFPLPGSATTPTYILGELNTGMPRVNSVSCVLLCHSPAESDIRDSSGVTFLLTLQTRDVEHYGKKMS